jgi:hypothetical protein
MADCFFVQEENGFRTILFGPIFFPIFTDLISVGSNESCQWQVWNY